jgi:hypothetical protein
MRYEVLYPFTARDRRFTAEDAGKVHELPKKTRDKYVGQGNLREIPPEAQPEPVATAPPRKRSVTVKKTARAKAPAADVPPSTNQGSGDAPADKE